MEDFSSSYMYFLFLAEKSVIGSLKICDLSISIFVVGIK